MADPIRFMVEGALCTLTVRGEYPGGGGFERPATAEDITALYVQLAQDNARLRETVRQLGEHGDDD